MIQTEHICLRAPELKDLDVLYTWENDPALWIISNTATPFSKYILEQYILNAHQDIFTAKQLRLMIDLHDGTTIGSIDLFDFDPLHQRAGIGIYISESFRKKGFASEALAATINYAFATLHLHQLYCSIDETNVASMRLFSKYDFVPCGIRKAWLRKENNWLNEHLFQLIHN